MRNSLFVAALSLGTAFVASAKMTPEQVKQLPAPAVRPINFTADIKPILEKSCVNCHGHGRSKGKFRVDNRETFLAGGDSGSPITAGKSDDSLLIELVMGFDPDTVMPAKGSKLKPEQIALLRAWIDQGAKWDEGVWLGQVEAQNLHPVAPEVPAAASAKLTHPVDKILDGYFRTNGVKWPNLVDDRTFARRAYLDAIGVLPSAEAMTAFLADKSPEKRTQLVEKLLADDQHYAEHWMSFWDDLLRNDYKGTGYIDGGRKQITQWLYNSLATNKPYNQFVAELVNPTPESEGFTKGIVWRGVVNASQVPQMQAAQTISQVFMGINMKCASCHDSFVNDWQLADAYALANVYADKPLELFECDKPTGRMAKTKFLYPEFGTVDAAADKATRLKQLAECVTSPKNGRLTRTLVNRLWGRLYGRALVEPVDDMEKPAWNPDLLNWLAEDFAKNNYDLRHLLAQMMTARAYQLPAGNLDEQAKTYTFTGPVVRRLTAEQFRDALTSLTGIGYSTTDAQLETTKDLSANKRFAPSVTPNWIWNQTNAPTAAKAGTVYFRRTLKLDAVPAEAVALVSADNTYMLYVNGQKLGSGKDWSNPELYQLGKVLHPGENVIAIAAVNNLPGDIVPTPETIKPGTENAGGLMFYLRLRTPADGKDKKAKETKLDIASDDSWVTSDTLQTGWETASFDASAWTPAIKLGGLGILPWRVRGDLIPSRIAALHPGKFRAVLVAADPLAVALGRPNREQVVTTRPSLATTLQALELTNGDTITDILKKGAQHLTEEATSDKQLVNALYLQGLGRKPTSAELKLATEIVGKPVRKEGVEDLLWAMTMLPEFQLIY